jgi:hypothetical protein
MRKLLFVLAVLVIGASARADTVNVGLIRYNNGNWAYGYPYFAVVFGFGLAPVFTPVLCDDYEHSGNPPSVWRANTTNLGSRDLTLLRFNEEPDALLRYQEAGWLLLQTLNAPRPSWVGINYAIWSLFDPNAPLTPLGAWWLRQAERAASNGFPRTDFTRVEILTPLNQHDPDPNRPQELMYIVITHRDDAPASLASTP